VARLAAVAHSRQSVLERSYAILQVTEWQSSKAAGGIAMSTRKLLFKGSTVLPAGSLKMDDFLQACREQPVVFEVSRLLVLCKNKQPILLIHAIYMSAVDASVSVAWSHTQCSVTVCVKLCFCSKHTTSSRVDFIKVNSIHNLHAIICDYHHSVFSPHNAVKI